MMVNYEAQVNQMSAPYFTGSPAGNKKRTAGLALTGGLIGMNAYYIPVKKDEFINRAFEITKDKANTQIEKLKSIAEEVEKNKISTESKMILQDMGLTEDIVSITNKCTALDRSISEPTVVKALKKDFAENFAKYKKDISLMDNNCAEAFKAVKRNKFKWGAGIGLAIGLALGLLGNRE